MWRVCTGYHLLEDGVDQLNNKVGKGAVDYLKANPIIDFNSPDAYYHAFTLAKVIIISQRTDIIFINDDWYTYISEELLLRQTQDGSWPYTAWLNTPQKNYVLNTILSILALELNKIPSHSYSAIILR